MNETPNRDSSYELYNPKDKEHPFNFTVSDPFNPAGDRPDSISDADLDALTARLNEEIEQNARYNETIRLARIKVNGDEGELANSGV